MEAEMHGSASTWTRLDLALVFNSCSRHIVICWWSVVFVWTNGANCEESLQLQWDYIGKKRRGGLKKQQDGETSKWQSMQGCVWMMAGVLFW